MRKKKKTFPNTSPVTTPPETDIVEYFMKITRIRY